MNLERRMMNNSYHVILVVTPFGIHETHFDSKIKDSVETTSNPFDNESTFLSTDSRKEQRRKGKKRKSRFSFKHRRSRNSSQDRSTWI